MNNYLYDVSKKSWIQMYLSFCKTKANSIHLMSHCKTAADDSMLTCVQGPDLTHCVQILHGAFGGNRF